MSNPTPTQYTCKQCKKKECKPFWIASKRKYCSRKCKLKWTQINDPDYWKRNGAKADFRKTSATHKRLGTKPPSQLGRKRTKKQRLKQSQSALKAWAEGKHDNARLPRLTQDGRRRKTEATQRMRRRLGLKGRMTDLEKIINNYLHKHKIKHEHEYPAGRKCMDFYLPDRGMFIEADSDYWHQDKNKDKAKDRHVKRLFPKIKIIRCNEKSIKNGTWINKIKLCTIQKK